MAGSKILVVEDEFVVASDLKVSLEGLGYEVAALAATGAEAIDMAGRKSPDLVLMDIVLRGEMDGITAAAKIREAANIPVVFLSAYSNQDILERAKISQPFGYLLKPVNKRELHATIQMALYQAEMEEALRQSEERFRLLADFTYDWEYWVNPEGGFEYVSPSCRRVTGRSREEFLKDPALMVRLTHEDDREMLAEHLAGPREDPPLVQFDFRILASDGRERWLNHSSQPVYSDEGQWLGRRGSIRDITDRVVAETEVKKQKAELEFKKSELIESNTALKVLLRRREEDKLELESNIQAQVKELLMPHLKQLTEARMQPEYRRVVELIQDRLNQLTSSFARQLQSPLYGLSSKEIQIAGLIREGRSSKEIADVLGVSTSTVNFHRNKIRQKLGIINQKANLQARLNSLF